MTMGSDLIRQEKRTLNGHQEQKLMVAGIIRSCGAPSDGATDAG